MLHQLRNCRWFFACCFSVVLLASCSDGGSGASGTVSAAMIGPAGGALMSADGNFSIQIPAGALGQMEAITITTLSGSDLIPPGESVPVEMGWSLEPAGLQLAMPATITVDLDALSNEGAVAEMVDGEDEIIGFDVFSLRFDDLERGLEPVEGQVLAVEGDQGTLTAPVTELRKVLGSNRFNSTFFRIEHPAVVPQGGMVTASAALGTVFSAGINDIEWSAAPVGFSLTTDMTGFEQFESGAAAVGVTINDSFNIGCVAPSTDEEILVRLTFKEGNSPIVYTIEVTLVLDCDGGMTPQPASPFFVALGGILNNVEAANAVAPGSPYFDSAEDRVIVAGQSPGFGMGYAVVGLNTGNIYFNEITSGSGTAFDVLETQSRDGSESTIVSSGTSVFAIGVQPGGILNNFGQNFSDSRRDANLAGGDPRNGAVLAGLNGLGLFETMTGGNSFSLTSFFTPEGLESAIGATLNFPFMAIGADSHDFLFLTFDGALVQSMSLGSAGIEPRRLKMNWDEGFGVSTDFAGNTLTRFAFDGVNPPTIQGVANVGSGPVGGFFAGGQGLSVGFNDDSMSRVEYDSSGNVLQVTTIPLPNPAGLSGPLQPGHITVVNGTGVVSLFGQDGILVMPGILKLE